MNIKAILIAHPNIRDREEHVTLIDVDYRLQQGMIIRGDGIVTAIALRQLRVIDKQYLPDNQNVLL